VSVIGIQKTKANGKVFSSRSCLNDRRSVAQPISPVAANLRMNETLGNPLGLLLS
jgi:hypothetical protein